MAMFSISCSGTKAQVKKQIDQQVTNSLNVPLKAIVDAAAGTHASIVGTMSSFQGQFGRLSLSGSFWTADDKKE